MIAWFLGGSPGPVGNLVFAAPSWLVLLAALAAAIAWLVAWRGERPLGARLAEMALWGLALVGVVLAVSRPVWVEEAGRVEGGRIAVLVDASRSMAVLEGGRPRSDDVAAILGAIGDDRVDLYHFGEELRAGSPAGFDLGGTDLEGALEALSERVAGERLAGVVVITDGLDRGLLRRRYQRESQPAPPRLPGPLTVYQVGTPGDLRDIAIQSVEAGGFAFLSEPFQVRARVFGMGYAGERVPVSLTRDGRPESQRTITLDAEGHGEAVFEIRPAQVGRFTYEVSTPVLAEDAVPANNTAPVVVRVVRDRIRVLQVAGAPSWDVKFLRRFLKGDPSVDLVSFFILRTMDDIQGTDYRDFELSLIQFPYQDLFNEQLDRFDLIIFQNFDQEAYLRPDERGPLLDNIRRFVQEEGKGFVMLGGERSFDLGGYAGTWVEDMLPVDMGVGQDAVDTERFRAQLTDEGRRHPITRLVPDLEENELWWSRLSELDGVNRVVGPSEGSTVLLSHPTLKSADGSPMPVLAVSEAGAGRAMALTVDTSWRWSFGEAASGRGNQAYLRFWKNAFRWLVKDPSTRRVTVDTPRENYAIGDTVRLVVRARDVGFAPLPGAKVLAVVRGPDGEVTLDGETNADGEVALEVAGTTRGAHQVTVRVLEGGAEIGKDSTVFAVTTRDPELDEVAPDPEFTRWLAASVQGEWRGPGDLAGPLRDLTSGRTVIDRKETEVWRAPILGLLILAFAGAAWIVRRRAGVR